MELYVDLCKAQLNLAKLVKRAIQVHGKNGKVFTRMQWVDPKTGEPVSSKTGNYHAPTIGKKKEQYPYPAPLGLKHTDHGLSDEEVRKRHGETGSIDIPKLTQGSSIVDKFKSDFDYSQRMFDMDSSRPYADVRKHFRNIFKNITMEGLNYAFSHPEGKYQAEMIGVDVYRNSSGYVTAETGFSLMDKKGNEVGRLSRSIYRDERGSLHVGLELLEIDEKYQHLGVGTHVYQRAEQLWKHLSDGYPVHIRLLANISVGVYAWAKKGFDFASDTELRTARDELKTFLKKNGLDVKGILNKCGYEKLEDLKTAEQFANLDDGELYSLKSKDSKYRKEIHGEGNLGKAFMLGGKTSWAGLKTLNSD